VSGRELATAIAAQTIMEVKLTLRRGESVLVTIVIPAGLLVFFASARVLPRGARSIDFLLPGTMALAVISTGLVSLGIATAYERYYGVLKRFGATPFPRSGLIAAKLLAVIALEAGQIVVLVGIAAVLFGWRPHGEPVLALAALVLGTAAFAGLGLLMAGGLRAEMTLAGANGLFLVFLLLGGLYVPLGDLPDWLASIARVLPAAALADVVRSVLRPGGDVAGSSLVVLAVWAVAAPVAAAMSFRWE
jgi:ABC-2 type transport system permease protein